MSSSRWRPANRRLSSRAWNRSTCSARTTKKSNAWPSAFVYSGLSRLVDIGALPAAEAEPLRAAFEAAAKAPGARMVTPAVAEIIARKT